MGFLKKKKKQPQKQDSAQSSTVTANSPKRRGLFGGTGGKHQVVPPTPTTVDLSPPQPTPSPPLLSTLNIYGSRDSEHFEILTPEARLNLEKERRAIRKNLFTDSAHGAAPAEQQQREQPPQEREQPPKEEQQPQTPVEPASISNDVVHHVYETSREDSVVNQEEPFDEEEEFKKDEIMREEEPQPSETLPAETLPAETLPDDALERFMTEDTVEENETHMVEGESEAVEPSLVESAEEEKKRDDIEEHTIAESMLDQTLRTQATTREADSPVGNLARKLFDTAFLCGGANHRCMDLFYDKAKPEEDIVQINRPYYDEEFTKAFLRGMMSEGSTILYLQPNTTFDLDSSLDWNGRTVQMTLEEGKSGDDDAIQPKLEWTTIPGGQTFDVTTTAVNLLNIDSIKTNAEDMKEENGDDGEDEDEDELCFFTITTVDGDVHIFEATSVEERDRIVNGLKNVIARLAFHLIAGDTTASSELYNDIILDTESEEPGDLPSLPNPNQTMNRLSHYVLD